MNKSPVSGFALEKAIEEKLRELLGRIPWLKDWKVQRTLTAFKKDSGFDLAACLPLPGGMTVELHVQCKADPRPSQFPYVDASHYYQPPNKPQLFVFGAPYISPRMSEICQKHNWSWLDLAGNYWLSVPGVLHLERTGGEPVHKSLRRSANLSTPEAGRIIRALLATDNAGRKWTQQDLRLHSQPRVSIGLVNKVVRHLHDEAFIQDLRDGGFKLSAPLDLLTAWRDAYRFDRHQRRGYFSRLQGRPLQEKLASLESIMGGHAAYAAFSAADYQAPHVRQPKTWLFVGAEWEDAFRDAIEAKIVDSGENLLVFIPADEGVFYLRETKADRLACTNAVQTYVDLFHCAGRGEEAAAALLEQNLKSAWKARGLL